MADDTKSVEEREKDLADERAKLEEDRKAVQGERDRLKQVAEELEQEKALNEPLKTGATIYIPIRATTQARLQDLAVELDQTRAAGRTRDTWTAAGERQQQSIQAVIRDEQRLTQVIQEQQAEAARVRSTRPNVPTAQQPNVDSELQARERLIQQHQAELALLQQRRVRLEENAALATATTDEERAGIRATTDAQLRSIQMSRDEAAAIARTRDVASESAARRTAALDEIIRREERLTVALREEQAAAQAIRVDRPNQPEGQQDNTQSELTARQRIIDQRIQELLVVQQKRTAMEGEAEVARATSDTERDAIRQRVDSQLTSIRLQADEQRAVSRTRDVYAQTLTQTTRQVQELATAQARNDVVVGANVARIEELRQARRAASEEERAGIDAEITALERTTEARQADNARIEERRVLIGEETALAAAGSEEERTAIRQVTAGRLAELSIIRDQTAAQDGLNGEVEAGVPVVGQFISMFSGIGGVMLAMQAVRQVLQDDLEIMKQAIEAGKTLRDQAGQQFDVGKKFNEENGLFDAAGQAKGQQAIVDIQKAYQTPQQVIAETGAALGATLQREAVAQARPGLADVSDKRTQDLIGTASLFTNKGITPQNLDFYVQKRLEQNPDLTGKDLNQQLSNLLRDANSSPDLMNQGLSIYNSDFEKYAAAGLGGDSILKLFSRTAQTAPKDSVTKLMNQYGQGLDRMLGLHSKGIIELAEQANGLSKTQIENIDRSIKNTPEDKLGPGIIRTIESMRNPARAAMSRLDPVFEQALTKGAIDIPQYVDAISHMSQDDREGVYRAQAAHDVGGPRNTVAMGRIMDYRIAHRPTGAAPQMPVPNSPVEQARVAKEQADQAAALASPEVPAEASFTEAVDREVEYVQRHADEIKTWAERNPRIGGLGGLAGSVADDREIASARVLLKGTAREPGLMGLARQREQIASGAVQATPEQAKAVSDSMTGIMSRFGYGQGDIQNLPIQFRALFGDVDTSEQTPAGIVHHVTKSSDVLSEYDRNPEQWLRTNRKYLDFSSYNDKITDDRQAGPILQAGADAVRSIQGPQKPQPVVQGPPKPAATPPVVPNDMTTFPPDLAGPARPSTPAPQPIPAPTSRPSSPPVSVNYHQRITNYGYSSDAVGAPAQFSNNYG